MTTLSAVHQRAVDLMPPIPKFLMVANRRELSSEQFDRVRATHSSLRDDKHRFDCRKPKGLSWEEWDAAEAARMGAEREDTIVRISRLRESLGLPPVEIHRIRDPSARSGKNLSAGSKAVLIGDMLLRDGGCTIADVLAATGWPTVSMPQQARICGLVLRKVKDGKISRYYAVRGVT